MNLTMTTDPRPVTGPWHDPALAAAERARALLATMTPAEKVRQLGSTWPGHDTGGDVAPMQDTFRGASLLRGSDQRRPRAPDPHLRHRPDRARRRQGTAGGTAGPGHGREPVRPASDRTRGVPHRDSTTWRATIYPTPLAWAATWDPALVRQMAAAIGSDMAAVGVHHGLAPVLDVVRDYRWGRVEETMGEDPYLVSELGLAYVRGPAVQRRHRDGQAFRRVLRVARGAQPRSRGGRAARTRRRDPAAVREGRGPRRGRLGDERLQRSRRRTLRRRTRTC